MNDPQKYENFNQYLEAHNPNILPLLETFSKENSLTQNSKVRKRSIQGSALRQKNAKQ